MGWTCINSASKGCLNKPGQCLTQGTNDRTLNYSVTLCQERGLYNQATHGPANPPTPTPSAVNPIDETKTSNPTKNDLQRIICNSLVNRVQYLKLIKFDMTRYGLGVNMAQSSCGLKLFIHINPNL